MGRDYQDYKKVQKSDDFFLSAAAGCETLFVKTQEFLH